MIENKRISINFMWQRYKNSNCRYIVYIGLLAWNPPIFTFNSNEQDFDKFFCGRRKSGFMVHESLRGE